MKLSLQVAASRAARLDHLVGSEEPTPPAIAGGHAGKLEASLHEIGHVVTLRGSLRAALRAPVPDVNSFMSDAGLYGVMRDENEVSTIAVELLAAELLGHPIDQLAVIRFAWENKNVRYFTDITRFHSRVLRRMRNHRCIRLAREVVSYLARPVPQKKRVR